jgi:hypothetical protein
MYTNVSKCKNDKIKEKGPRHIIFKPKKNKQEKENREYPGKEALREIKLFKTNFK